MFNIHESVYIHDSAVVSGNVTIGKDSTILFNASIRGDNGDIVIGERCSVQDNSVIHSKTTVGNDVTIGHRALVHGCTIGDRVLVGMGAIIMDKAVIGENCIIGAGSLITKGKVIPPNSLVYGNPAKVMREISEEEYGYIMYSSEHYVSKGRSYKNGEIEFYGR